MDTEMIHFSIKWFSPGNEQVVDLAYANASWFTSHKYIKNGQYKGSSEKRSSTLNSSNLPVLITFFALISKSYLPVLYTSLFVY